MLKQIPLTCSGHARPVVSLAFSDITSDGSYFMLSASKDGQPMLRQGDTGDWIGTFLGHKGAVWGCALNSDATKAVTASADFTAKYWDATTGAELHTFSLNHIVRAADLNKKGDHLLVTSKQHCFLYDANRTDADPITWEAHAGIVKRCAFIDTEHTFAITAGDDNKIKTWDLRQPLSTPTRESDFGGAQFSDFSFECKMSMSDPQLIITVACGRKVQFYNANLDLVKSFDSQTTLYSAALSPDGCSFVCGGEDFKIYRYRYEDCKELENSKGHFGPVHCVRFSPDGEVYASGSEDGTVRLWQTNLGKDYGLWKVDRTLAATLATSGVGSPLSTSPSLVQSAEAVPHVISINVNNPGSTVAPIVITPKSPTAPVTK